MCPARLVYESMIGQSEQFKNNIARARNGTLIRGRT